MKPVVVNNNDLEELGRSVVFHQKKKQINPVTSYIMTLGSEKSRATMISYLKNIAKIWGFDHPLEIPWHEVDKHEVLGLIEVLSIQGYAAPTIRTYNSAIKGVAKEAWNLKIIDADHLERIKSIKTKKGRVQSSGRRLFPDEIKKLIESCDETPKGARDKAIISIASECGLRRSEIVGIDKKDYDRITGSMSVTGKGNKHRKVFLPALARNSINNWIDNWRGDFSGPLFNRILKNDVVCEDRLTSQAILYILNERRKKAGIEKFSPHDLRRTFATTLFENDIDPLTVQKAMGHQNLSTTELYDKRGEDRVKEVAEKFSYF